MFVTQKSNGTVESAFVTTCHDSLMRDDSAVSAVGAGGSVVLKHSLTRLLKSTVLRPNVSLLVGMLQNDWLSLSTWKRRLLGGGKVLPLSSKAKPAKRLASKGWGVAPSSG